MTTNLNRALKHIAHIAGRLEIAAIAPRSLYLSRDVLNGEEIAVWARSVGITDVKPELFHVTVAFSKDPVNWMKLGGSDYHNIYSPYSGGIESKSPYAVGSIVVEAGGPKMVDRFDGGAVVLVFNCETLKYRNQAIIDMGGSWDHPTYQPHITLTYDPDNKIDVSKLGVYPGQIVLGPEKFAEVDEDWKKKNYGDDDSDLVKAAVASVLKGETAALDPALQLNRMAQSYHNMVDSAVQELVIRDRLPAAEPVFYAGIADIRARIDSRVAQGVSLALQDMSVDKREAASSQVDARRSGVKAALMPVRVIDPEANYCVQPDGTWMKEGGKGYDSRGEPIKGKDLPSDAEVSRVEAAAETASTFR